MTGDLRTQSGNDRMTRLADWVNQHPDRQSITRDELSAIYKSRRVTHAALAEAVRVGLLKKSATGVIQITPKLTQISRTRLQSGDCLVRQKKDGDSHVLLGSPAVASLESCSTPNHNLILNQLPEKFRTPRRQESVSRNCTDTAQNSELSTGSPQPKTQFLETAKSSPEAQFLDLEKPVNYAKLLNGSNCPKSLAAPCFEENPYPKDKDFDEETLKGSSSNSITSKIQRAGERAHARSELRAKSVAAGRQRSLDTLKDKAKSLAKAAQEAPESSTPVTVVLADEADSARAYSMAVEYERCMKIYRKNPHLKVFKGNQGLTDKSQKVLARAAKFAEELGVDYETYMKAQFWAMHEWFKRPPKLHQIASFKTKVPAKERVKLYLKATRQGQVSSKHEARSLSRPAPKVSLSVRFQNSERQLRRLMQNYEETEEEILCRFASGKTAYTYFDREWLSENTTYQRLVAEGRI